MNHSSLIKGERVRWRENPFCCVWKWKAEKIKFAIYITPGEIPYDYYDTVIARLAKYLDVSKSYIDNKVPKSIRRSFTTVQIKTNVPFDIVSNIAENKTDLPGVSWGSRPIRNYMHTPSLSHIIDGKKSHSDREVFRYYQTVAMDRYAYDKETSIKNNKMYDKIDKLGLYLES